MDYLLPQISCIIPFWNEGLNLFEVLDEITRVRNLDEIICVDDASQDGNAERVISIYPDVKLVRLEKNRGKSGAVKEGLKHATNDLVLLLDADLRNLDFREIEKAIGAFRNNINADMLILRRVNAFFYIKMYRADVLFTGERIIRKKDLEIILSGCVRGWQLESAINTWMFTNDKKVLWVPHSATNRRKFMKWGFLNGFKLDMKTFSDMITAAGFNSMVKQILFFARDELKLS